MKGFKVKNNPDVYVVLSYDDSTKNPGKFNYCGAIVNEHHSPWEASLSESLLESFEEDELEIVVDDVFDLLQLESAQ